MVENAIVDVVGVGFGPSNLALAVAFAEMPERDRPSTLFIERKREFTWHPGMLIDGSRAQVPFFKDLATLRDPTSRFTYLSWLHERGLLFQFVASRDVTPLRSELDAYYRWAASHFTEQVRYGQRVVALRPEPAGDDGRVTLIRAVVEDVATGRRSTVLARNAVVAPGGTARVPACAAGVTSPRVFHTNVFLDALHTTYADTTQPYRFVIVGAGQSAGDTVRYLLDTYPRARVDLAFRGYAPRPLDESPFVNELFDPEARQFMLSLSQRDRDAIRAEHHLANYAAVDLSLLVELHRRRLNDAILGKQRLGLLPFHELCGLDATADDAAVTLRERLTGRETTVRADGVVLATGYDRGAPFLDGLTPFLRMTSDGTPEVEADYRLSTTSEFTPAIFVQGLSESTHGLSDTLLSLLSVRAGEIADSLAGVKKATATVTTLRRIGPVQRAA
jgi:L-ornithine N5-monooxygenase